MLPIVAITMGCPVGIGPEIIARSLAQDAIYDLCCPVVIGDRAIMERAIKITKVQLRVQAIESLGRSQIAAGRLAILEVSKLRPSECTFGQPTAKTGQAMVDYIEKAVGLALSGEIEAIVTSPINKAAMHLAGYEYPGHTELLAHRSGASRYAMMLVGDTLRVVPATIHVALRMVPKSLTAKRILEKIVITFEGLREYFGLENPRLAVCGLNPHAGEGGLFGNEELRIIAPAIRAARKLGIDTGGPFPADTIFYRASRGEFDAVIAMYHDQALIPLKLLHFKDGVNLTLGLPLIRTSVDHGTAYDLAGTGKADPSSLLAAIELATRMHKCKRKGNRQSYGF